MEGVVMDRAFWAGKRVFLTGHTGFKGSWMSLWLADMGATVIGYSRDIPTQPSLFEAARVAECVHDVRGDIRDASAVRLAMLDAKPDIVIHMAAQPLVRYSYVDPVETIASNVLGTAHVLEAVRATDSVRVVVNVTSDKCYENREWLWGYRENDPMGGYDPYSASKGCAELVAAAYRNSFFNPADYARHRVAVASVRAGNVIGGGDWALDRLVPDVLRAFESDRPVIIRNPHAIRPWQHVLEPLSGYLTLAQRLWEHGPAYAEGWNFGPNDDDARPVSWIVEKLVGAWGAGASWQLDGADHPHEAGWLKLDCSKAHVRLGWRPRWTLDQALMQIVSWHRAWLASEDMQRRCVAQITEFEQTV